MGNYFQFKNDKPEIKFKIKYGWKEILSDLTERRFFKIFIWIILPVIVLVFWIFRYDDFFSGCHIRIQPSILEWNNLEIKRALKLIKQESPEDYREVCKYVDLVSPDLPCGGAGGGCFHDVRPKTIEISTLGHRGNSPITASIIVHETCHSRQKENKKPYTEDDCNAEMNLFLNRIGIEHDINTLFKMVSKREN